MGYEGRRLFNRGILQSYKWPFEELGREGLEKVSYSQSYTVSEPSLHLIDFQEKGVVNVSFPSIRLRPKSFAKLFYGDKIDYEEKKN